MKKINEIITIVKNMADTDFKKLLKANYDYWDLDKRISKNGLQRLKYNLKKYDLTVEEWIAWCEL